MNILQINTADIGGGAERVAWDLYHGYSTEGHQAELVVGRKHSSDPFVFEIPPPPPVHPLVKRICQGLERRFRHWQNVIPGGIWAADWLNVISKGRRAVQGKLGHEVFYSPGSKRVERLLPTPPDIIHLHNLHGRYFDLRTLPALSHRFPTVMTMHDAWLLSGHCAHSLDCDRWKHGCGKCPYLNIYPAVLKDATAANWRKKRHLLARSRLFVVSPSAWLLRKVPESILQPAVIESRIIPNGIDTCLFRPRNRAELRKDLGLKDTAKIIVFSAVGIRNNVWKDYKTMRESVARIGQKSAAHDILFLALGEEGDVEKFGNAEIRFIPKQTPENVARYLAAADIYLHGAKVDTFPNSVLEAQACGTPVVATAIGGIPEQIRQGETGFLVPGSDAEGMSQALDELIRDDSRRNVMGERATAWAAEKFTHEKMICNYLELYREMLARQVGS
ncbi:MAG: glycosyltransferase [Lentisphaeria bacterium]|nr:glycosyltransferase [Lentisphaeria bacterium]